MNYFLNERMIRASQSGLLPYSENKNRDQVDGCSLTSLSNALAVTQASYFLHVPAFIRLLSLLSPLGQFVIGPRWTLWLEDAVFQLTQIPAPPVGLQPLNAH